jgi:diguanylate cyclase (GGDEF)-like protein/PAS domain S-box-containing protein
MDGVKRFALRTRIILLLASAALAAALTGYVTNAGTVVVALVTVALAFVGIEWLLFRRLRGLSATVDRLRHEAGPTTVGAAPERDELDRIGVVINDLAAALRQRQAEQRVTETRLANIVNISSDAIISVDDQQRIVLFNHGAEKIFGFRADEIIGQPVDRLMPDRFAAAHRDHVREFGSGSVDARPMAERREIVGRRKDGTEFPAEATIARTSDGGRTLYTTILRDVTERKHSESLIRDIAEGVSAVTGSAFFRSLLRHLARTLEVEYAFVGGLVAGRDDRIRTLAVLHNGEFVENFEYDLRGTPCEHIVGRDLCIYDDQVQQRFPGHRLLVEIGAESYMGVPLFGSAGRAIGLMAVLGRTPMRTSLFGESLFRVFAVRASAEFERQQMVDQLADALKEIENVMETIPDVLYILDLEGRLIRWNQKAESATRRPRSELDRLPLIDLIVPDERAEALDAIQRGLADGRAEVEARLLRTDGTSTPYHWSCASLKDSQGRATGLVGIGRDISDRRRAEATIRQLAYYDSLTMLPNRTMVHERLAQAVHSAERRQTPVAFLLLGLNDFRNVNNTLGHRHGDLLLQQIGPRLRDILRQSDTVARLGGDEFALLLPDTDLEGALRVAKKAHQILETPFNVEGLSIGVEASIGVAMFPDHGTSASIVMQRAGVAMYAAKQGGGGSSVYAADRDHYSPRRLALLGELRYAIDHGELILYFQPKIHMQTRRVIGVEALVRWKHPHRGMIPPDDFIPLAERSGLIRPLTQWVLSTALDQARKWEQAGFQLSVAVNLSARNLLDAQIPDHLTELLRRAGTPANRLELEITESTIMADPARALEVLTRLHGMGIPLAIDDFGTGYSSLGYLKRLPVLAVKVDKTFVKNMETDDNDAVIVRSTIELAHNLGLQVIAEGVETSYLWDRLASLGCDAAQGYYISQPMPPDELSRWFVDSPWQVAMVPPASSPKVA